MTMGDAELLAAAPAAEAAELLELLQAAVEATSAAARAQPASVGTRMMLPSQRCPGSGSITANIYM